MREVPQSFQCSCHLLEYLWLYNTAAGSPWDPYREKGFHTAAYIHIYIYIWFCLVSLLSLWPTPPSRPLTRHETNTPFPMGVQCCSWVEYNPTGFADHRSIVSLTDRDSGGFPRAPKGGDIDLLCRPLQSAFSKGLRQRGRRAHARRYSQRETT